VDKIVAVKVFLNSREKYMVILEKAIIANVANNNVLKNLPKKVTS